MRKPVTLLASVIVCLAPVLPAGAEVDLFDIQAALLLGETTVKVPAEAQEADLPAIRDCIKGAKSITLDLSATKITELGGAFKECTALKAVILPSTLTTIGDSAFLWCTSLTSLTIPSSVTSIGASVFHGCKSLSSVTIPASVTSIGEYAFYKCGNLSSVTFESAGGWYLDETLTQSVGSRELSAYLEDGKALYKMGR